ncbi:hypothetical protein [Paenibacillus piscarius]|uniref:hypothetical protein n=1 Tax=Paenibacillus piscarius TaxID=1089681 RepID=UPI001EE858C2|nr:hypothetical protein [Paenibacillus piscarius]
MIIERMYVEHEEGSVSTDPFVIGDEGCIYKATQEAMLSQAEQEAGKGRSIRYITPFVPEQNMQHLYDCIYSLAGEKKLKVTFNDYGFLFRCLDLIKDGNIIPVLGRLLTRSIIDSPWSDEIMKQEEADLSAAVLGPSFIHEAKIEVLNRYNIYELEVNICAPSFIEEWHRMGMKVTGYANNALISIGRTCYSARWHAITGECSGTEACRSPISIELSKKWSRKNFMYQDASHQDRQRYGGMYILGNAVYRQQDSADALAGLMGNYDYMIV